MQRLFTLTILSTLLSLLVALPALAEWQLSNDESRLSFVTTKNSDIAETHSFESLTGDINAQGQVRFQINLASVNTAIAIRDQRMQNLLFELERFVSAEFTGQVDMRFIEALPVGQIKYLPLAGDINLHGNKQAVTTKVQLIKLARNRFAVNAVKPVLLNAKQYDLVAGIEKLREIAGLNRISNAVPITFNLVFDYKAK